MSYSKTAYTKPLLIQGDYPKSLTVNKIRCLYVQKDLFLNSKHRAHEQFKPLDSLQFTISTYSSVGLKTFSYIGNFYSVFLAVLLKERILPPPQENTISST